MGPDDIIDPYSPVSPRRQLRLLLAMLALPSVAIIGGMFLSDWLIASRCPAGTAFSGWVDSTRQPFFQICSLAFFVWLGSRQMLVKMTREGRLVAGRLDPERVMRWCNVAMPAAVAIGLGLAVTSSYAQFCVLSDRIIFRARMAAAAETYSWADVRQVTASCMHISGRSSRDAMGYVLTMANGRRIDLADTDARLPSIVHAASAGLRNLPYAYDASRVSSRCDPIHTQLLVKRPTSPAQASLRPELRW